MAHLRNIFHGAFTGNTEADVSGNKGASLRGQLLAIGGKSTKTKSGIDLTRAAQRLGVTRRTVERWLSNEQTGKGNKPSKAHAENLAKKARQAGSTKTGRAAAMKAVSKSKRFSRGAHMTIDAVQGPAPFGVERSYQRLRSIPLNLSPESMDKLMGAYADGGEKRAKAWLEEFASNNYVDDWQLSDIRMIKIDSF